jgi:hypothetical protein
MRWFGKPKYGGRIERPVDMPVQTSIFKYDEVTVAFENGKVKKFYDDMNISVLGEGVIAIGFKDGGVILFELMNVAYVEAKKY